MTVLEEIFSAATAPIAWRRSTIFLARMRRHLDRWGRRRDRTSRARGDTCGAAPPQPQGTQRHRTLPLANRRRSRCGRAGKIADAAPGWCWQFAGENGLAAVESGPGLGCAPGGGGVPCSGGMGTCRFPMPKVLAPVPAFRHIRPQVVHSGRPMFSGRGENPHRR